MSKTSLNPAALAAPTGYSHVTTVRGGTAVYVSGQIAFNQSGQVVGVGDMAAQARQVFENLKAALAAVGAAFKDVIKLNSYIVNITPERVAAVRTVRRDYLGDGPYPSSTTVGVTGLVHPDLLVEIEVIAFLPDRAAGAAKAGSRRSGTARRAGANRAAKKGAAKQGTGKQGTAKKAARRR